MLMGDRLFCECSNEGTSSGTVAMVELLLGTNSIAAFFRLPII